MRAPCLHVLHMKCAQDICPECEKPYVWEGSILAEEFARRLGKVVESGEEATEMEVPATGNNTALTVIETESGSRSELVMDEKSEPASTSPTVQTATREARPAVQSRPPPIPLSSSRSLQSSGELKPASLRSETKSETRLNVGPTKALKKSSMSTSWKRSVKAGSRKWFDLKKVLAENQRQVFVFISFIVCVVLVVYLMSGEDEPVTVRTVSGVTEDIHLPHVRVNPAFLQQPLEREVQ